MLRQKQTKLIYKSDWNILVILDACRFDVFSDVCWFEGKLCEVWSAGSCTDEWFLSTFKKPLKDVILISPHPFFSKIDPKGLMDRARRVFRKVVYVSRGVKMVDRGIYMGLAPAEPVTDTAIRYSHLNTRLLVHYCQPHFPALGTPKLLYSDKVIYEKVKKGEIPLTLVKEAYVGNLKYVLREVQRLLEKTRWSKAVITSDHGELLGEHGMYGHPPKKRYPELRLVPWMVVQQPLREQTTHTKTTTERN